MHQPPFVHWAQRGRFPRSSLAIREARIGCPDWKWAPSGAGTSLDLPFACENRKSRLTGQPLPIRKSDV